MEITRDVFLLECPKYEDYLDTYVTTKDHRYLRNIQASRMLVELGYRSTSEIYTPEQYKIRKEAAYEAMYPIKKSHTMFHVGAKITDPVLHALAEREKSNFQKILSTIIFIRRKLKSGFEISGYIDYEDSLRKANLQTDDSTDWHAVFKKQKKVEPNHSDLSYYNTRTSVILHNDSHNYIVINDHNYGLLFMHRGDRKKISVDERNERYKANACRSTIFSEYYGYVIIYDHIIRRKA